jgi:hypothetical protein
MIVLVREDTELLVRLLSDWVVVRLQVVDDGPLDECAFLWRSESANDLCSKGHRVV